MCVCVCVCVCVRVCAWLIPLPRVCLLALVLLLLFFPDRRFLRGECTSSKWAFDEPLPVGRLVGALGESELPVPQ